MIWETLKCKSIIKMNQGLSVLILEKIYGKNKGWRIRNEPR